MTTAWDDDQPKPQTPPLTAGARFRFARRAAFIALVNALGFFLLVFVRLIEAPLFRAKRPWTPWITQAVCRLSIWGMGLGFSVDGTPMRHRGAIVANHVSWLDIYVLNAPQRIYFVSKAEVSSWPGIGWLARATGTVFINRRVAEAEKQRAMFRDRLKSDHRLAFFPEGTSTDGIRVLPFKSTLFAAFFDQELAQEMYIQPVSLVYHAPDGADPRFYGWWSDMSFGGHLQQVLAVQKPGRVEVVFHPPMAVREAGGRKQLAQACEVQVRGGLETRLPALSQSDQSASGETPAAR